ncbi:hypothetical protein ACHRVZ_04355 [Flavobacterium sp. FlaQc-57]|uniref:hypothetical protein n=1 Tax=Flavobacterium sp. FlaQc-57 TaxID=3374186 RepID=UPI003757A6A8
MSKYITITLLLFLFSCNKIENHKTLSQDDINRIKSLKILDDDETIYQFYSEFKNEVAGNFYTNKRVASYWIDKRDAKKNKIDFAYYKNIVKIDTIYNSGLTFAPYILITTKDNKTFQVSVDGKKDQIKSFFENSIQEWRKRKN